MNRIRTLDTKEIEVRSLRLGICVVKNLAQNRPQKYKYKNQFAQNIESVNEVFARLDSVQICYAKC